jgi:uncharacterized protein YjbI with pentapeptide repeats
MSLNRKVILLALTLTITNLAHATTRYDQNDQKKFIETNQCIGCNLSNDIFANHPKANLDHANISSTYFYGDNSKSNYSNTNGIRAFFSSGSNAKFNNAILIDAKFDGNFTNADFTGANLQGANFTSANLFGAKISEQQLKQASSVCNAILPDGVKGDCN